MTSTTAQKTLCIRCDKTSGLFTCRGCGKDFCMCHANEHRQELGKQMDELTLYYDEIRQKLTEETTQSPNYPHLKQKIDQWEQQSIDKIYQVAGDLRKDLENMIQQHSAQLTEALTKLANEINYARQEDEYLETDIQQWTQQLNKLKDDLTKLPTFDIQQEENVIPLISRISIDISNNEVFERTLDNIELEDNDQAVVHGQINNYATARGKSEYLCGQHRLRLKIEEYNSSKWIFVGIISKDVLMKGTSVNTPSIYGWAGADQVYINGFLNSSYNKYQSDIQKNDILELFIDCDERKICLRNERTHSSYELNVDLNKCPFPWQLNVIMYFAGDRIRFLST
jgi:hypothetical protein